MKKKYFNRTGRNNLLKIIGETFGFLDIFLYFCKV